MGRLDTGIDPRELLGKKLYDSVYAPLSAEEADTLLEQFSKQAANDALHYRKVQDADAAADAESRAERFRSLGSAQEISEEAWNEFSPWLQRATEKAQEDMHKGRDEAEKKSAATRTANLRRLQDFLQAKIRKAA